MKTYVFEVELEKEEALESLKEAAQAYLEVLFKEGRSLPISS